MKNYVQPHSFIRRLMRLTFSQLAMWLILTGVSFASASDPQHILEKRITLEIKDQRMEDVLKKIETELRVRFAYSRDVIASVGLMSIDAEGEKLADVLNKLLKPGEIRYEVVGKQVILSRYRPLKLAQRHTLRVDLVQEEISGKVTTATGEPIPGVNVLQKGTTNGTTTDADGNYTLVLQDGDAVLVFSFIGYASEEVAVNARSVVNVTLNEDMQRLDEVVVIGYGTKEKGQLTGSVANVSGETLKQIRTTDLTKSLQGMMPGLVISDRGGAPGSENVDISIRGTHTLGDNSPLVIIDGVPRSGLGQLSPADIEEITVLKDASAAIYGAQAANGVIIVRTKRGKAGQFELRLNSSYGLNALTRTPKMMDSWQWATYQNEVQEGYGMQPLFSEEDIQKYKDGSSPITHPNTDFYGLTFRKYAPETTHNLSASGGSETVRYFISGDYSRKESQYSSEDGEYKQFQMRSNIDAQVHKYLNLGMDIGFRSEQAMMPAQSIANIIHRAYFNYPIEPAFYPNGLPYFTREGGGNPVVMNSFKMGWNERIDKIVQTKISFDLNMDWITKGLGLIGYGALDYTMGNDEVHEKPALLYKYNQTSQDYDEIWSAGLMNLAKTSDVLKNNLYHIRLAYNNQFGNHDISAFAAYEQNETEYEQLYGFRRKLFSESKVELFAGEEDGRVVNGISSVGGRVNYFGHIAYDYMRKYMIDFTIRHDGSFNFPENQRFGTFPGVSAGWNISREPFMGGIAKVADNIKLRASYGKMGNDRIPAYQYLTKYGLLPQTDWYNIFITGVNPAYNPAMDIINVPNPNITWEVAEVFNYGFDAVLWKKLSVGFDYFIEHRRGILIRRNESVPEYTGLALPQENLGEVDNSGVEIMLNYKNGKGNLHYQIGGNFSFNRSKIIFMDEPKDIPEYQRKEGYPVNSILAYQADGIFNSQEELDSYPRLGGAIPGDIKYVDVNNDGQINLSDQVRHRTSHNPEIQFALNAGLQYKGFELYVFFQGAARATSPLMFNDSGTKPQYLFTERWTESNPDAVHPRPYAGFDGLQRLSTYHFNDASYLRLKNVELSYNLASAAWVPSESVLKNIRVYFRGRNLWTLDHLKYFDPEVPFDASETTRGSRAKYYPQLVSYTAGIDITL